MLSRRSLIGTGVAALAFATRSFAARARHDLILRGGRVIDPSRGLDAVGDVAVTEGRIAAVAPQIAAEAEETLDARGKLVVPGLIDIHTHATTAPDGPSLCLADGVTGWIDAGSQGADHIDQAIAIARSAPQQARVMINIGRAGIIGAGDTMNLALADVQAARSAIMRHRDFIVGVKARLSRNVCGDHDYEVLRRAQEVATPFGLPVMIHMGDTFSPMSKLAGLLKRRDIVTHLFSPPPHAIIDDTGNILPEVLAARKRGVWFDLGNGRLGHVRWDTALRILGDGFLPDTISTDWTPEGQKAGIINMPNIMSSMLSLGIPLAQVVAWSTVNPAKIFDVFNGRGTLAVGAPADITVLEMRTGNFEFVDAFKNIRPGNRKLFASATVLGGKWLRPQRRLQQ